jgi:hypothetical protein
MVVDEGKHSCIRKKLDLDNKNAIFLDMYDNWIGNCDHMTLIRTLMQFVNFIIQTYFRRKKKPTFVP